MFKFQSRDATRDVCGGGELGQLGLPVLQFCNHMIIGTQRHMMHEPNTASACTTATLSWY